MQRHHLPAGHNDTPDQFPRISRLDARSANPIEAYPPSLTLRVMTFLVMWGWLVALLLLSLLFLTGCDASAEPIAVRSAREDAEAISSREWAGVVMCGPKATPDWLDDKSLRCLKHQKERP